MLPMTDQDWITRLKAEDNSAALEELRLRLERGLTYALSSRIAPEQLDDAVQDFAQEAVLRVLANLNSFRGESRFLTWATKVAVRLAFSELRRKRWQDVSLESLLGEEQGLEESNAVLADPARSPESQADISMVMALVQRVIDEELTENQRLALHAVMDSGIRWKKSPRRWVPIAMRSISCSTTRASGCSSAWPSMAYRQKICWQSLANHKGKDFWARAV